MKDVTGLEEKLCGVFLLKQSTPGSAVPLAMFAFNVSCYASLSHMRKKSVRLEDLKTR